MDVAHKVSIPSRIFIIGPMGAGKSTVGKRLAQMLDYRFIDSDQELEQRTGVDIPFIFDKEGEAGFRRRERQLLDELTQEQNIVLASGGGAILDEQTRANMKARGYVVYLHTTVDEQLKRTRHSQNRPLLQTPDRHARLTQLMAEREPLYRQIADCIIFTDTRFPRTVATQIRDKLRSPP